MTRKIRGNRWGRAIKGAMMRCLPVMMSCREFEDALQAQLSGPLSPYRRGRFRLHLRLCRECRDYLAAYQRTLAVTKAVCAGSENSLPDETQQQMVKAILKSRRRSPFGDEAGQT